MHVQRALCFQSVNWELNRGAQKPEEQDVGMEGKGPRMRRDQLPLIKPFLDAMRGALLPHLMGSSPDTHLSDEKAEAQSRVAGRR